MTRFYKDMTEEEFRIALNRLMDVDLIGILEAEVGIFNRGADVEGSENRLKIIRRAILARMNLEVRHH